MGQKETYLRNLETLERHYPGMRDMIEKGRKSLGEEVKVMAEEAYDGTRILRVRTADGECYLSGKREPRGPAREWARTLGNLQENAPVFLMGVGDPAYLEELAGHAGRRLVIVVYEPSLRILLDFLERHEIGGWMGRHTIVFCSGEIEGMSWGYMRSIIGRLVSYGTLPLTRFFVLQNYDVLFPEETLAFVKACNETAVNEMVQFNTLHRFEGVYVKNLFANSRHLCSCYKTTQLPSVIPQDIPGIVVAAGPSLNRNIGDLRDAKGRALIIAVDTAIKPLLNAGVEPDMYVIVDAKKPLSLVEDERARDIPLVTTVDAASEVLDYHRGMKFFANEGVWFVDRLFARRDKEAGTAMEGGSVATAAFTLLYKIGIQRVILVGQDLAFTGNRSHADGTFEERMPEEDTSRFLMVEGNVEEKVPTRGDFQIYLNWYNSYIKGCQEHDPDFRVINATEGGAKIQNTEVMTLRDAIRKECGKTVDIQACLGRLRPLFEGEDREWAIGELKKIPDSCGELQGEAEEAAALYRKLGAVCGKPTMSRKAYLGVLKKLRRQVGKVERHEMYQLANQSLNAARYIIQNEQLLTYDSVQEEGMEIARKGALYMESVARCAGIFQEYARQVFDGWEPGE